MATANDYWKEVGLPGSATTLASPGYTIGSGTINVGSTANWPTTTGATFAMDTGSVVVINGQNTFVRTPGSYTEYDGVVSSGTTVTGLVLRYGTAQNYPAGATTRVYIPVTSSRENRIAQGIAMIANQDATLKTTAVTSALTAGTITNTMIADVSATKLTNPYKFKAYRNASFSLTAGAYTKVPYDTEKYDTSSNFDVTTNIGRFTAPVAGTYHFNASVLVAATGPTVLWPLLYKNGVAESSGSRFGASVVGSDAGSNVSDDIVLATNDYVEVYVFCNGAAALTLTNTSYNYFSGHLVSKD